VDGTGSELCLMVGFDISGAELSSSATTELLISEIGLREMSCGDETGSCPMVGFGPSSVEPTDPTSTVCSYCGI
jgi:hypothetical protein